MFSLIFTFVFFAAVDGAAPVSTAPTTQPANSALVQAPANPPAAPTTQKSTPTLSEVLGKTRLGQLFEGNQTVTIQDVRNPLFWLDTIRDLALAIIGFIPRIVVAVLFVIFFWVVNRAVRKLVIASMKRAAVDPSIRDMLALMIKWAIMGFGLVIACNQIGIQIEALLTGVGVVGLAVGFAAQETIANFIAGIVIFWDKPFKMGDWLEVGETYGQVQRVTFRSTRILDNNGLMIIFPNTYMLSNRVSNHTTHPLTRLAIPIGIAYKESIDDARKAMLSTTQGDDRVSHQPAPQVVVANCSASSVDLLLRFWIRDESLEKALLFEYIERCKKALDAAGISIPFPHVQVMVEETPAIEKLSGLRKSA